MIESLSLITGPHPSHPAATFLSQAGYDVKLAPSIADVHPLRPATHAVILPVSFLSLKNWSWEQLAVSVLPVIWWCEEANNPLPAPKEIQPDGILFSSMSALQIQWSIHIAASQHAKRAELIREKEALLHRLEERKWIEQAKGILCELKKINEEQAYQFLRQQAMNERKKMVDVARSIVNVYRLIHG